MQIKLLILGFDGMSYRSIMSLIKELPSLQDLTQSSQYGLLRSIKNPDDGLPHTGPCWSTIYTGVLPQNHGVTEGGWLLSQKGYSDIKTKTIWEIINEKFKLGLMTMPITYPAFPIEGWMISGFPSPPNFEKCVYPNKLIELVPKDFKIDYVEGSSSGIGIERYRYTFNPVEQDLIEESKIYLSEKLAQKYPTEVIAIGLTFLDRYGHTYPQYLENNNLHPYTRHAYRKVNHYLKLTLEKFNPENIVICSDHGFEKFGIPSNCQHDDAGFYLIKNLVRTVLLKKRFLSLQLLLKS